MGPVGHSDPLYEGSPMEADSFWRCTGSAGVRPSVESGKDTNERLSRYHLQRCASIGAKGGRRLPRAGLKTGTGAGEAGRKAPE